MHMYHLFIATLSNRNLHHIASSGRQHIATLSPRRHELCNLHENTKKLGNLNTKHSIFFLNLDQLKQPDCDQGLACVRRL